MMISDKMSNFVIKFVNPEKSEKCVQYKLELGLMKKVHIEKRVKIEFCYLTDLVNNFKF